METLGYPTEAVALPSVGTNNVTVGLAEDTAALRDELTTLTDAGKDIIMVVHSYGGMVGTNAVQGFGYADRAAAGQSGGVIMVRTFSLFPDHKPFYLLLHNHWILLFSSHKDGTNSSSSTADLHDRLRCAPRN